jgi:hypothetical protein
MAIPSEDANARNQNYAENAGPDVKGAFPTMEVSAALERAEVLEWAAFRHQRLRFSRRSRARPRVFSGQLQQLHDLDLVRGTHCPDDDLPDRTRN